MRILKIILFLILASSAVAQNIEITIERNCLAYKSENIKIIKKQIKKSHLPKPMAQELTAKLIANNPFDFEQTLGDFIKYRETCPKVKQLLYNLLKINDPLLNRQIIKESYLNYIDIEIPIVSIDCNNNEIVKGINFEIALTENQDTSDVHLGHIAHLICYLQEEKTALQNINKLKTSSNVYAKFTYAQMLFKYEHFSDCSAILTDIIDEEITYLNKNIPISKNYVYVGWSIYLLKKINSGVSQEKYSRLKELYLSAIKLYGNEGDNVNENKKMSIERALYVLEQSYKIKNCP